ncbi:MAG: radical SAM protein [Acidobacteria bacterium]|nr:radical SAM protein [Acidobacteriota bacterium]
MEKKRILLMLLPYWDPQVPPLGISCLKSVAQEAGFYIKTIDANVEANFREIQDNYYELLARYVPEEWRRHLRNVGHDVLRNHMTAHLHYDDEKKYMALIKDVIFKTFATPLHDDQIRELNGLIANFYISLEKYIMDCLEQEKPAVLGLSVYSGTLAASLFTFKLAKQKFPGILTVMGGGIFSGELAVDSPNFSFFLEKTPYIDKIIVGEGEQLFLRLLKDELPPAQRVFTIKDQGGNVLDLAKIAIPDFSDFDLRYYPHLAAFTSRSCPFQCTFCVETVYWGKFRKKSGLQVAGELKELYRRHGTQLFVLCDSLLNPVINDLAQECMAADLSLYWDGYLRADPAVCSLENTISWRRGGFYRARLGLESGSERMLEIMGKKISVDQVKKAVSSLAQAGIKTTTMWVIGHPGETEDDFQETLNLIEELRDDIYEADCNPFWYFLTGQANSAAWAQNHQSVLLYPEEAKDMLILQTWILDCDPPREEIFRRVNRFAAHLKKLEIPNPYTLRDFCQADERWKKLHKNAVPTIVELNNPDTYISENKKIKNLYLADNPLLKEEEEDGFHF